MKTTTSQIVRAASETLSALSGTILFKGPGRATFPSRGAAGSRDKLLWSAGLACLLGLLPCLPSTAATLLVWPDSPTPASPYTNWETAAQTIQAAVDAAQAGDTVLVTNGVYAFGGQNGSRVALPASLVLQSLNGPALTIIDGGGSNRCVYLAGNGLLSGFTLTNGHADSGGGVSCQSTSGVVTNCTLTGNSASSYGGGAYSGTLNDCSLMGNSAGNDGGGAYSGTLNNCALTGNSVLGGSFSPYEGGGGAYDATLNHCALPHG